MKPGGSERYLYLAYAVSVILLALVLMAYFGLLGIAELFDDFDTLDPNRWSVLVVHPGRGYNVTVENGYLRMLLGVGANAIVDLKTVPAGRYFEHLELVNVTINITRELYTRPSSTVWETSNAFTWGGLSTTNVRVLLGYSVNGMCYDYGVITCTVTVEPSVAVGVGMEYREYILFSYTSSVNVNESMFPAVHFDYIRVRYAVNETGRYVQVTYVARVYSYGTGGELVTRTVSGQLTVQVNVQGEQKLTSLWLGGLNYGSARIPPPIQPPDQPTPVETTDDAFPITLSVDKLYVKTASEPSPPEPPPEETQTPTTKVTARLAPALLIAVVAVTAVLATTTRKRTPVEHTSY